LVLLFVDCILLFVHWCLCTSDLHVYSIVLTSDFVLLVAVPLLLTDTTFSYPPLFFPAARSQTSTTTHATLLLSIGAAESSGGRNEV